ncbi:MAG: extensin family protein [Pseudomonadota bacterium]
MSPDANASSATHGVQRHQVGDFLNSVRRAINRGSKRRGRRARGSDTPILDKPPTLPVRSAARASGSVEALPEVVSRSLRPAREEAQPAKGLPTPSTKTTLALPPRRPKQIPLPSRRAKVTAAVAVAGKTAAAAATPPPKVWSAEQIRTAYDQCDALLAKLPVTVTPVKPIRKGACGTPGPVALSELGESTRISVRPAATLNCRTVKAVHRWFAKHVQPAASEVLGTQVVGIRNVSSYSCRNRNNAKTGRLSEHAYGNALDIAAFKLADGRTISLLGDWGPVARDQKKDEAVETLSARSKPTRRKTPKPIANADLRTAAVATSLVASASITDTSDIPLPAFKGPVRRGVRLKPYLDAGAPKPIAVPATPPREYTRQAEATEPAALPPESVFLRRIHSEACEVFGTVLGPEANDAHRDHFHVDMAKRRYRAYCR